MKKAFKLLVFLALAGYIGLLSIYVYAYFQPLPMMGQSERLLLLDCNQTIYYESNFEKKSNWLNISDIPEKVLRAFVSVEDKRFYTHYGFDPIRLTKAVLVNLQTQSFSQGGSTITQQYARNLFLDQEKTLNRKFMELYYAMQIEMHYSKEQILEGYLNTLYFGHGIYGVQNAATFFFQKDLQTLTDGELAMLIGIVNAPSYYSPFLNLERSTQRQRDVLYAMRQNDVLKEDAYQAALNEKIVLAPYDDNKALAALSAFYKDSVMAQLRKMGFLSEASLAKGLRVETYYDPVIQKKMNAAIKRQLPAQSALEVSAVIVEPFTGNIRALAGGKDYTLSQFNRALYAQRQIASTIKPLLYYLALDQGFTPSTTFLSQPTAFKLSELETYTPTNFNDLYPYSEISMLQALGVSDNIYAVKTHLFLGTTTLYNAMQNFGFTQTKNIASLALGSVNMSVVELSRIYNTFASEGLFTKPQFIHRITDMSGKVLYERADEPRRLLDRDQTLLMNQMLRSPFDIKNQGYTSPSLLGYEPRVITAAKSGTSNWDSWIAGFNPDYTVVVWNGYDNSKEMKTYNERKISRLIYRDIFNSLYTNKNQGEWYVASDNLISIKVNPVSGKLDANGSVYWYDRRNPIPIPFISEAMPSTPDEEE